MTTTGTGARLTSAASISVIRSETRIGAVRRPGPADGPAPARRLGHSRTADRRVRGTVGLARRRGRGLTHQRIARRARRPPLQHTSSPPAISASCTLSSRFLTMCASATSSSRLCFYGTTMPRERGQRGKHHARTAEDQLDPHPRQAHRIQPHHLGQITANRDDSPGHLCLRRQQTHPRSTTRVRPYDSHTQACLPTARRHEVCLIWTG